MLTPDIAFHALVVLVCLLGLVFLFLLGYTFWTRAKKWYWHRYKQKFRDYFSPLIFDFVEGNPGLGEANALIAKLSKQTQDIAYFLELLDEMTELVKGEDREKLNLLIEHEMFHSFYRKKLFSFWGSNQLLACIYFENSGSFDERIRKRLVTISQSGNLKLAYAACKALQASDDIADRKRALLLFLRRDDISGLMVSELLHLFYRDDLEQQQALSEGLKDILLARGVFPRHKRIVVLFMAQKSFLEQGDFLLEYLKKVQYSARKALLIYGLIEALGKLHVTKAAPIIYEYMELQDTDLRIKCVEALGRFGDQPHLRFLGRQLLQVEFPVRKAIIRVLTQDMDKAMPIIDQFFDASQQLMSRFARLERPPKALKEKIQHVRDTIRGLQIMMSKQIADSYV